MSGGREFLTLLEIAQGSRRLRVVHHWAAVVSRGARYEPAPFTVEIGQNDDVRLTLDCTPPTIWPLLWMHNRDRLSVRITVVDADQPDTIVTGPHNYEWHRDGHLSSLKETKP